MAIRTDAPGLKRRPRKGRDLWYWMPTGRDIESGYPIKSVPLDPTLTPELRAKRCRELWAQLVEWRQGNDTGARKNSIRWLIRRYQTDEFSPYRHLRDNSRKSYDGFLRIIDNDIGTTIIGYGVRKSIGISGEDFRRWHKRFGKPDANGKPTAPSRARHLIVMLRALFSYAVEIGVPAAKELRDVLSVMRFPSPAPRDVAPTVEQVMAIVDKAEEMKWFSVAAVTMAQFEFSERRISVLDWRWENVSPDWKITYYQNKRGLVKREYDIKSVQALLTLLQMTPKHKRKDHIFRDKAGQPWSTDHYIKVFRRIANAAGLPGIWSMDMRAAALTEADGLNISTRFMKDAAGHSEERTTDRYRRNKQRNAQNVVEMRQFARTKKQPMGTALEETEETGHQKPADPVAQQDRAADS